MGFAQGLGFGGSAPAPAPPPQVFTALLVWGALASPANTFLYFPGSVFGNAAAITRNWRAVANGELRRPRFWNQIPSGSAVVTYTLRINGVATAWVIATTSGTAGLQVVSAAVLPVVEGDLVEVLVTAGGSATQCCPSFQCQFWETP